MDENYGLVLIFTTGAVAVCSFLSVAVWVNARRLEREALYRSQAIQKLAEMQGSASDATLQLLREALVPKERFPRWGIAPQEYRREREAYYRSEAVKSIAAMGGNGPEAALQYLREEEQKIVRRRTDGFKLGGMILIAVGSALMIFLYNIVTARPVYLAGLIPLVIGIVLLSRGTIDGREK